MILILIGIVIFSTITAAISSYLTDNMIENEDDGIEEVKKRMDEESKNIKGELEAIRKENKQLYDEISELKELIKNK